MGRPRKGEVREPTKNFTVNLTDNDRKELEKLSQVLGIPAGRVLVFGMRNLTKNLSRAGSLAGEAQKELAS
jgi:hypothetical protein